MSGSARVLCEGIYFGEGPRWRDSRLWFSDFYAKAVKSASLAGDVRTEFVIDDLPSGLGWMPDGSMLIVSMTSRRVLRRSPDGAVRVHAELADIATFHCNDMVVDAAGRAYVGNFGFDLHRELAARGDQSVLADHPTATLARVSPEGVAAVAAADLHFPNGTVITPDGKTLIVGETLAAQLTAFDIGPAGALSNRRVWASTFPPCSGRDCARHRGRRLDRQCARARKRALRPGRRGAGDDRNQPELFRLHARRRRRQDALHDDRAELHAHRCSGRAQGPHRSRVRPRGACGVALEDGASRVILSCAAGEERASVFARRRSFSGPREREVELPVMRGCRPDPPRSPRSGRTRP